MSQHRSISAWLLLLAFAVGGVAGPALHRGQHGAAQIVDRADKPCHADEVHAAEGPVWANAAVGLRVPECTLCAMRHLMVPPTPVPTTAPHTVEATAETPRSHVATTAVSCHCLIRGPPSLLEARPA